MVSAHASHLGLDYDVGMVLYRTNRCRLQCSHMRGIPSVSTEKTGQGHMVAARMYLSYFYLSVGSGLAREYWLEGMLRDRATFCSAWVRGDYGLSRAGSLLGRCIL